MQIVFDYRLRPAWEPVIVMERTYQMPETCGRAGSSVRQRRSSTMPISVVIPAYRAARTIRRAVDSVLAQTLPSAEILVVDDGSPDGGELAAALESYGSTVTLLRKENGGASSARNYGIEHARGEWIAFLDADDYWEPDKLERQRAVPNSFPDVQLVGCCFYVEDPGAVRKVGKTPTPKLAGRRLAARGYEAFRVAMVIWTGGVLVRRMVLQQDRFVSGLEPAEDRDLWFRLLNQHPAYILPEYLATYVQEPGGISRCNVDRDCSRMLAVIERCSSAIGPLATWQQVSHVYQRWAAEYLDDGHPQRALPYAIRRLCLQPYLLKAWWIVAKSLALTVRSACVGQSQLSLPAGVSR